MFKKVLEYDVVYPIGHTPGITIWIDNTPTSINKKIDLQIDVQSFANILTILKTGNAYFYENTKTFKIGPYEPNMQA